MKMDRYVKDRKAELSGSMAYLASKLESDSPYTKDDPDYTTWEVAFKVEKQQFHKKLRELG